MKKIIVLFMLVFLFVACLSDGQERSSEEKPAWVDSLPAETNEFVFFRGVASDPSGNEALAREEAANYLVSEITRFLGVRITSDTTVEAREELGEYQSSITQMVRAQSSARIAGFQLIDSFVEMMADGTLVVHVLGQYERAALLSEKARLEQVFREQAEAISGPEAEGDRLIRENRLFEAAVKFLEAANAAAVSEVDNAPIMFERNMNKARNAVSRIVLTVEKDNHVTFLDSPFDDTFDLRLTADAANGTPLPGANILVLYRELRPTGRFGNEYVNVSSDSNGLVRFSRPSPQFVGPGELNMSLDFSAHLSALEQVPDALYSHVRSFRQLVNEKERVFRFQVDSLAKLIPTAIFVGDLDNAGNTTGSTRTAAGILESLSAERFDVAIVNLGQAIGYRDLSAVRSAVQSQYSGQYERVILGAASIDSVSESAGNHVVRVSGTVQALDLETGRVLYTETLTRNARARTIQGAIDAAFLSIGQSFGLNMLNGLP